MDNQTELQNLTFIESFQNDSLLENYGQNALAMFVMKLYLGIDDLESFATDSITDGGNDKKIDLCYIDITEGRAIIGQSYLSPTWGKEAANANKASYINTGLAWLLSANLDKVPRVLQPKAQELRDGISTGDLDKIEIVFIHNAYSSSNVANELTAVTNATADLASRIASQHNRPTPTVVWKEYGLEEIEELFQSIDSNIILDHWIDVPTKSWIFESGDSWNAVVASVDASWIRELRRKHQDNLVSANFRNYLGARATKSNINHQIKQTVASEPENFWVYNNGITALTHQIQQEGDNLKVRGISIINGAQTSGALGESDNEQTQNAKVLLRVVTSDKPALINKIIRYNNTQNKIVSSDKRSNEGILKKLVTDFQEYDITFVIRRSSVRNPRNSISSSDMGRILSAFHGRPQLGYRNPSTIFDDDSSFQWVFPNDISAEHIFLISSLAKAYDHIKSSLKSKVAKTEAIEIEENMYEVLKFTSSRYFIIFVIGVVAEQLKGQRIPGLHTWKAKPNQVKADSSKLESAWIDVLNTLLPLIQNIVSRKGENAAFEVPRSTALSEEVAKELQALMQAMQSSIGGSYKKLQQHTIV